MFQTIYTVSLLSKLIQSKFGGGQAKRKEMAGNASEMGLLYAKAMEQDLRKMPKRSSAFVEGRCVVSSLRGTQTKTEQTQPVHAPQPKTRQRVNKRRNRQGSPSAISEP